MSTMPHTQKKQSFSNRSYPPEDEFELYDKLVMGEGDNGLFEELHRTVPTGYLDRKEIDFMREIANELNHIRYIESRLKDLLGTEVEFTKIKNQLVEKILFYPHSSKGLQGFGIKAVGTQRLIQDEKVFQRMKEERKPSTWEKVKQKGGRAVDDITGGGNVEYLPERNSEDIWQ